MTNFARTFVQGAFLSSFGMLVSMVCGLGGAIIFTQVVPSGDVGLFNLLILGTDLFVLTNNLGLVASLPKLVASAPDDERPALISSTLLFQSLFSLALAALVYAAWFGLADPSIISTDDRWLDLFPYLGLLPLLFFFANLRDNAMAALAGLNRYGYRAAGLALSSGAYLALIFLFVGKASSGLPVLIAVTLAFYVVAAAWFCAGLPLRLRPQLNWRGHSEVLRFSFPLYINGLMGFVLTRLDTVFVFLLLGPAKAAYFELAAKRLPSYFSRLVVSGVTPYLPGISALLARNDTAGASALLNRTSSVFSFIGYLSLLVMLPLQLPLILLLFPDEYGQGVSALPLIMASICLAVQAGVMGQTLIALGKPQLVTLVNIVTALVSAAANLLLIPLYGILGAGWAAVIGIGMSNAAQTWLVHRHSMALNVRHYLQNHLFFILAAALAYFGRHTVWQAIAIALYVVLSLWGKTVRFADLRVALAFLLPGAARKPAQPDNEGKGPV